MSKSSEDLRLTNSSYAISDPVQYQRLIVSIGDNAVDAAPAYAA